MERRLALTPRGRDRHREYPMLIRKIVAMLGKIRSAFGFVPDKSDRPLYVYDRMHINFCVEESKLGSRRALWSESVWRCSYLLGFRWKIESRHLKYIFSTPG